MESYFEKAGVALTIPPEDRALLMRFYRCAMVGSALDWLEGGMVALQILVYKASKGRKQLFGTAPLHRWLEKRGFDPVNIFYIFGVLAMLGLALTLQAARAS